MASQDQHTVADTAKQAQAIMTDRSLQMAIQSAVPSFGVSLFLWLHWHYLTEHIVSLKSKCMFGDTKLLELGIIVGVYLLVLLVFVGIATVLMVIINIISDPLFGVKMVVGSVLSALGLGT